MAAIHRIQARRGRTVTRWALVAVGALLIACVLWIAVRALIARGELLGAVPLAHEIASTALAGDGDKIAGDVHELQARAASAASLTSDPIWRAAEVLPFVGANLSAFRQAAEMIHGVADDALPPLAALADTITIDSLTPKNGSFDLAPFTAAAPMLSEASAALDQAVNKAMAIDTSGTVDQIGEAVDQLVDLVGQAKGIVGALNTTAALLPSMMGSDGPRSYLLLSLNNSELRSTGGIPGAIAVVTADHGTLTLGDQSSAAALGAFDAPALPLTAAEVTLYKETLGLYMQDVNFTPDFARSGELAQAMWQQRTGQIVDGVVAVDPVALSYILKATGPIDAGSGVTLSSDDAVKVLLSDVYSQFPKPADQDAFFAGVTQRIFDAVVAGTPKNKAMVEALAQSADEQRIHIWSAQPDEEKRLAGSTIGSALPVSTVKSAGFGVYFNDGTGAKMDYYLDAGIGIAAGICRVDERPQYVVRAKLTSTAPADAATSLPEYVTGGGFFGIAPGNVNTVVYVYAPDGAEPYSVTINGQQYAFVAAEHDGHSVAGLEVELAPGQSADVEFQFLGVKGDPTSVNLQHTPMASEVATSVDNSIDCSSVKPDNHQTTGALPASANPVRGA